MFIRKISMHNCFRVLWSSSQVNATLEEMDASKSKKNPNPRERANIISVLFWWWVISLLYNIDIAYTFNIEYYSFVYIQLNSFNYFIFIIWGNRYTITWPKFTFFTQFYFCSRWTIRMFKTGYRKVLGTEDLFVPLKKDQSNYLGNKLETWVELLQFILKFTVNFVKYF